MELPRLTPSNIADLECRKRYHVLRTLRQWPPRPLNLQTEFGIAFHEVVRHVYDPRHRPLPNLEHIDAWVQAAFYARRVPRDMLEAECARCTRLVKQYIANDEDADYTLEVERQGEFPIAVEGRPLFLLSAKLDRVIVRASDRKRLVVRDYKTSRPYRSLEEAFLQLWVAKLLYPSYKKYALELDWIGEEGDVERDVIEGGMLRGMHAMIRDKAIRVFTSDDHGAEAGEACFRCPLRPGCQPEAAVELDASANFEED